MNTLHGWLAAALMVLISAGQATAGEVDLSKINLNLPLSYGETVQVADNSAPGSQVYDGVASNEPFEEPFMDGDKLHGYLGAASFLAAIVAGVSAPENENPAMAGQPVKKGVHQYAAYTAAALGSAAVLTGFYQHWDDIEANPFDPDTLHMVLGALATGAFIYAVSQGPKVYGSSNKGTHAAAGIAGGVLMATALYIEF